MQVNQNSNFFHHPTTVIPINLPPRIEKTKIDIRKGCENKRKTANKVTKNNTKSKLRIHIIISLNVLFLFVVK